MTLEEARGAIEALRQKVESDRSDEEEWHLIEDELREKVLMEIADRADAPADIRELARIALSTGDIHFSRWYA